MKTTNSWFERKRLDPGVERRPGVYMDQSVVDQIIGLCDVTNGNFHGITIIHLFSNNEVG